MAQQDYKKHELAMRAAVCRNEAHQIRKYIADGGDLSARDHVERTLLHNAASFGKVDAAQALIEAGIDLEARDSVGETALHTAIRFGHADAAIALLQAGAKPDVKNRDGKTPFDNDYGEDRAQEALRIVKDWMSMAHTKKIALLHRRTHKKKGLAI